VLAFLYSVLLTCLTPTTPVVLLLVVAVVLRRHTRLARLSMGSALMILLVSGNGWVVGVMVRSLESATSPLDQSVTGDAIVILSGGILPQVYPRIMVEVGDAGDRVLYGAELFRQGRAPRVFVTGDVATGGLASRPQADDMSDLLQRIGVPRSAIIAERRAENTHEHAVNLCPLFSQNGIQRVLLVTSALHMRRSLGVFRRSCPAVQYVPAPTDFRFVHGNPQPWYRHVTRFIPTPAGLLDFSDSTHEYVGIVYYRLRGWL